MEDWRSAGWRCASTRGSIWFMRHCVPCRWICRTGQAVTLIARSSMRRSSAAVPSALLTPARGFVPASCAAAAGLHTPHAICPARGRSTIPGAAGAPIARDELSVETASGVATRPPPRLACAGAPDLNVGHAALDAGPSAAASGAGAARAARHGRSRQPGSRHPPGRVRDRPRAGRRRLRHRLPRASTTRCSARWPSRSTCPARWPGAATARRCSCARPRRPRPSRSGSNPSSTKRGCWPASTTRRWSRCTAAGRPTAPPTWRCSTTPASRSSRRVAA